MTIAAAIRPIYSEAVLTGRFEAAQKLLEAARDVPVQLHPVREDHRWLTFQLTAAGFVLGFPIGIDARNRARRVF